MKAEPVTRVKTPCRGDLPALRVGDRVEFSGIIYTGRDAVLPRLAALAAAGRRLPVPLAGVAIMHTAVSPAGFGPTSSNKEEIENAMGPLSAAGVLFHLGKGVIGRETVARISEFGAVFIVVPPVSALLRSRLLSSRVVAFAAEGMEAMHELTIAGLPGVVAAAGGASVFHPFSPLTRQPCR